MRLIHIALALTTISFAACNDSKTTTTGGETAAVPVVRPPAQSKLGTDGTQKLMDLMSKYYALKNALVATKAADATVAATALATAADGMNAMMKPDNADYEAARRYLDTVTIQSKAITGMDDQKCEKQRVAFDHVSSAIYGLLKEVEVKNAGAYRQYCPMAFNDTGAYWLSEIEEIRNPYFGKKMLECGEVVDSL